MAVEAHRRSLDRLLYLLVYMLNRDSCMTFNKLLCLFSLGINDIGISCPGRPGINLNEERFLRSIAKRLASGIVFDVGANTGQVATTVRSHCLLHKSSVLNHTQMRTGCLKGRWGTSAGPSTWLYQTELEVPLFTNAPTHRLRQYPPLEERTLEMFGGVGRALEVDTITIEAICEQHEINKINLLKIDTEGHDLAVLQGARRLIKDNAIDVIEFEFVPACIVTKVNMIDFFDLLPNYESFVWG